MRTTLTTLVAIAAAALPVAAADPAGAAFAGQNGKIAFVSNRAGSNDIFSANPDGSGLVNLTATTGVDELDHAWSADGRRLAFVRDGALWVMNADGSGQTQLTNSPSFDEFDQSPAWSPDGLEIAVARSDTSGNWGIWTVREAGGPARRLTSQLNDAGRDQWPAWSPDGSTIAFSRSLRGFAPQLVLVPADGSGSVQIVDTGITSSNNHPSWSPDGTKIAIDVNGGEAIAIFQPDGTRVQLGFVLFGQDPEWSPDGSAIVYNTRTGNREIEWAALDGTMSGSVTGGDPAADLSPTWQPAVMPNTPCCGPVTVSPVGPAVTITFSNVTAAGDTTVATSSSSPPLPSGFSLGNPPVHYDIATTATFTSDATVCIKYAGSTFSGSPRLLHYDGSGWVDATTSDDPVAQIVCGVVQSLSPFALASRSAAVDSTPPAIVCGSADGQWHLGNVTIACSASDTGSGLADPSTASLSLATNVAGGDETANAPTNSRQVCDVAGNCATAGPIGGNKIDLKAPTLNLPANVTVDATSPAGAIVTFRATAVDNGSGLQSVSCSPASGNTFVIGQTTVACTATDIARNSANGSFTVRVKGAKEQLGALIQKVVAATSLSPTAKALLLAKLQSLLASFDPANTAQRQAVCVGLSTFKSAVQLLAGHAMTQAQAAEWIADATRIRAVLAC